MPIKPENRGRYPANWKEIRAAILERADNKCEFCGIENYAVRDGSRVVLTIAHLDATDVIQISEDDVYIVWQVKVLQNNKALASTTLKDGMYYELTYDGDKKRCYVDAYKKWENFCVNGAGEMI